jgi:Asp-tRNA(Asn)/Glu-tRNA(Gln) amidotransferase A subunit family amidase
VHGKVAKNHRTFFETAPFSYKLTHSDCIAGFGLLTARRVSYIRCLLSWRPASAGNGCWANGHGADRFPPSLGVEIEAGRPWSAGDAVRASHGRRTLHDTFVRCLTRDHLLLSPTLTASLPSVQVEAYAEITEREVTRLGWLTCTLPLPLTGYPTATVPCGWTRDSLPVGWRIATPGLADRLVLRGRVRLLPPGPLHVHRWTGQARRTLSGEEVADGTLG